MVFPGLRAVKQVRTLILINTVHVLLMAMDAGLLVVIGLLMVLGVHPPNTLQMVLTGQYLRLLQTMLLLALFDVTTKTFL